MTQVVIFEEEVFLRGEGHWTSDEGLTDELDV